MDNSQRIQQLENAIDILEDMKQDIKNNNDLRATTFMEQILGSIFRDEIPYMLRQRLIELYKEYSIQSSGSDEWYGLSFQSEKEFKKIIKEIRLQLGKDD